MAAMLLGLANLAMFAYTSDDPAAVRFLWAGLLLLGVGVGSLLALSGTNLLSELVRRLPFRNARREAGEKSTATTMDS